MLATCPDPAIRDGKKVISAATIACEQSEWKDHGVVDALAAAHAEAGKFDAAVKWQKKAVALLPNPSPDRDHLLSRRKLHRDLMPYREPASDR